MLLTTGSRSRELRGYYANLLDPDLVRLHATWHVRSKFSGKDVVLFRGDHGGNRVVVSRDLHLLWAQVSDTAYLLVIVHIRSADTHSAHLHPYVSVRNFVWQRHILKTDVVNAV